MLVARTAEDLAGFLYAEIHGSLGYMALLTVAPAYRRHGVASKLLKECAARLRKKGVQRLGGFAYQAGEVVRFLERNGFGPGKAYIWMDRET